MTQALRPRPSEKSVKSMAKSASALHFRRCCCGHRRNSSRCCSNCARLPAQPGGLPPGCEFNFAREILCCHGYGTGEALDRLRHHHFPACLAGRGRADLLRQKRAAAGRCSTRFLQACCERPPISLSIGIIGDADAYRHLPDHPSWLPNCVTLCLRNADAINPIVTCDITDRYRLKPENRSSPSSWRCCCRLPLCRRAMLKQLFRDPAYRLISRLPRVACSACPPWAQLRLAAHEQ